MGTVNALWGNLFKHKNAERRDIILLLRRIPLFSELHKGELREIERLVHHRTYKGGEVVFWEDEPGVGMYIVQHGEVGIFKDYGKRSQQELARLVPGDFFGEMALLEDDCRSATAVALDQAQLFGLFHPDLFDLFERKPQLGVRLLSSLAGILAQRLRRTNQDLQRLARGRAEAGRKKRTSP
jgi:CRP/FNR family cyclic AMP-dependent transcriptional regulator